VNYWFHPADNLSPDGWRQPYKDPYWEEHYRRHLARFEVPRPVPGARGPHQKAEGKKAGRSGEGKARPELVPTAAAATVGAPVHSAVVPTEHLGPLQSPGGMKKKKKKRHGKKKTHGDRGSQQ
jgi:hypothetical protein